jgi:hypothetical protein
MTAMGVGVACASMSSRILAMFEAEGDSLQKEEESLLFVHA